MNKRAAKPRTQPTDNPDFVPTENEPPANRRKPPSVIKVTAVGFASFDIHMSDGEVFHGISSGYGSNAENAKARDRLVEVLQRELEAPA